MVSVSGTRTRVPAYKYIRYALGAELLHNTFDQCVRYSSSFWKDRSSGSSGHVSAVLCSFSGQQQLFFLTCDYVRDTDMGAGNTTKGDGLSSIYVFAAARTAETGTLALLDVLG